MRSYFSLLLGHWQDSANIERDLREIVNKSWELFLCLYPGRPILARNASLARSMKAQDIPQICEFKKSNFRRVVKSRLRARAESRARILTPIFAVEATARPMASGYAPIIIAAPRVV